MKKYLFINPDDILSFSLINECINNKEDVYILFNIKKNVDLKEIFNIFLKKFGYNKILEDNVKLIEFIPFKKNSTLYNYSFDRIIYINPYFNVENINRYYLLDELFFKNIVYSCSKYFPDVDFIYVDLINNINFTNYEYIIFKKYTKIIKKYIKNYNIYLTNSVIYLDNGYIDGNNIFSCLVKKVFYLSATNHLFNNITFNFININHVIPNILYDNIENKLILQRNSVNNIFIEIISNRKFNYNLNELTNFKWNNRNYMDFKLNSIVNYQNLKDINIDNENTFKIIEYFSKFNINNMLTYLQLNNFIPIYCKKKNYWKTIHYIFMLNIFLFVLFTIILYLFLRSKILKYILFILGFLSLIPIKINSKFKNLAKKKFLEIIDVNHKFLIIDDDIEKYNFDNRNYIYLFNPHDFSPIGIHTQIFSLEKYILCNHHKSTFFIYNNTSYFPFIKQFTSLFDCENADYNNIDKCLKNNKSAILYLGGIDETIINLYNPENVSLISIKNKTGLFKLSLINGVDIIPVYLFYNKNLYFKNNFILRGISNFVNLVINHPTLTIIGKPIKVNKIPNPTYDDIIKLRCSYIDSLKLLYNKYKCTYNWCDKELEIF